MSNNVRRIGLNAHLLNLSGNYRSAGINWYIYHLLQNLTPSSDLAYTAFLSEPRARDFFKHLFIARSRLPTHRPLARIFWEQVIQPSALRREKIDVLHALAFAGPLAISMPWLATIYDLSFARFPESFNRLNRIYLLWAVKNSVRRANRIIAISESTKRDLMKMFDARLEQIKVIYCGVDSSFSPAKNQNDTMTRAKMPAEFILHVGTIEPRKNIVHLIRAFAQAKRAAHLPHQLVLVGARGWKYTEIDQTIAQENVVNDVIFPGYVPQDELPAWYRAAELFVYPSLYEGFGLPPLEAMASGTPVITSNAASLPEVVGEAAIQVSPTDQVALVDAIIRALSDSTLREQMSARGIDQAKKFSWKLAGQETMTLYRTILAEQRGTKNVPA